MAAPDFKIRFQEVMKLFDYGFANYGITKGLPAGDIAGEVVVYKGLKDNVKVVVDKEIDILIKKGGEEKLESEVNVIESINAPFEKGTKAGEVIYSINGKEVGRTDLVTEEEIGKINIGTMIKKLFSQWCR